MAAEFDSFAQQLEQHVLALLAPVRAADYSASALRSMLDERIGDFALIEISPRIQKYQLD